MIINQPKQTLVLDAMLGLAVGDALGAPAEFLEREEVRRHPILGMDPDALFTDDTSMNLCLLDSLTQNKTIDYRDIMNKFILWVGKGDYTPEGTAFGMGITTMAALKRYATYRNPMTSGSTDEFENGNGALMRILPLSFYLFEQFKESFLTNPSAVLVAKQVIALTHAHPRNIAGCFLYLAMAQEIIRARLKKGMALTFLQFRKALLKGTQQGIAFLEKDKSLASQVPYYSKFFLNPKTQAMHLETFVEKEIKSSGYVVDTLEASVWCCLTTHTYPDSVLKASNLGDDADTVAAVTGGLSGLAYGRKQIPQTWCDRMVRLDMIKDYAEAYQATLTF